MEKTELRIGNLIHFRDELFEVSCFMDMVVVSDLSSPIPLTEEWLVKLGFEKLRVTKIATIQRYLLHGVNISFYAVSRDFVFSPIETIKVNLKFIHQLQNLYFALTDEELTIK